MNAGMRTKIPLLFLGAALAGAAAAQEPPRVPDPTPPSSSSPAGTAQASPASPQPDPAPPGKASPPAAAQQLPPETELPRETAIENAIGRTRPLSGSAFGGYGELTLNAPAHAPSVIDLRRFVLFFGHDFSEHIRFYSEVEVEHAVSSAADHGEVEIEQAYLDGLLAKRLNLRGGLIIMPVGIVNVYHEPPSFNGVDRPEVDQFVIPTTWREPGVGIFGELAEGLRYQLYLVTGFDANGFTAQSAIRQGHQEAQLAHAGDLGGVLRLDYEPVLGTVVGASGYGATSGNTLAKTIGSVPVGLFEVDVRTHRGGFTARAEVAVLFIGDAAQLSRALASGTDDQKAAGPVSSQSRGGYLEVGYDLLHLLSPGSEQALTAFGRLDHADTQADVAQGFEARTEFRRTTGTFGMVWRPIPQVAIKSDYRRHHLGSGESFNEIASAITWLF